MLTPGEFVVKKSAVDKYGSGLLHSINSQQFADGGKVNYFAGGGNVRKENIYRGDKLKEIWKFNLFNDMRVANSQKVDPAIMQWLKKKPEFNKLEQGDSYGDLFRTFNPRKDLVGAQTKYQSILDVIANSALVTKAVDPSAQMSPFQAWDQYRELFFGAVVGKDAVASSGPLSGIKLNNKGLISGVEKDAAANGAAVKTGQLPFSSVNGPAVENVQNSTAGLISLFKKLNFDKIFPLYEAQLGNFSESVIEENKKSNGTLLALRKGGFVGKRTKEQKQADATRNKDRADAYRAEGIIRTSEKPLTSADISRMAQEQAEAYTKKRDAEYEKNRKASGKPPIVFGSQNPSTSNTRQVANLPNTFGRTILGAGDNTFFGFPHPNDDFPPVAGNSNVLPLIHFALSSLYKQIYAQRKQNGGIIDSVPAMLTPGEFVVKKSAVDKYGSGLMNSINAKKFEYGGSVDHRNGAKGFNTDYGSRASIDINYGKLSDFNASFLESINKLQQTNMKFEVSLTNKDFNINILGADILSKLPEVVSLLVLGTVSSKIDIITQSVKKRLSSGI